VTPEQEPREDRDNEDNVRRPISPQTEGPSWGCSFHIPRGFSGHFSCPDALDGYPPTTVKKDSDL
jgi:hypothetical protein